VVLERVGQIRFLGVLIVRKSSCFDESVSSDLGSNIA